MLIVFGIFFTMPHASTSNFYGKGPGSGLFAVMNVEMDELSLLVDQGGGRWAVERRGRRRDGTCRKDLLTC